MLLISTQMAAAGRGGAVGWLVAAAVGQKMVAGWLPQLHALVAI